MIQNIVQLDVKAQAELQSLFQYPKMLAVPSKELRRFSQKDISCFCLLNGIYQLPTLELIDFLAKETHFQGMSAIEIGAGCGCIGRNLGITITDNCLQERPDMKKHYEKMGQKIIDYPKDIVRLVGEKAVQTYQPDVVIGCYVTGKQADKGGMGISDIEGINELKMLNENPCVKKYIMVGNAETHAQKLIFKQLPFKKLQFDWLYSRSLRKDLNTIYIYER